jgi:chromosome segregation protein
MSARLKSLELTGYKTFANRTVFEFADRVTAIVGPNGSGKSNIADSLRWVLGEQSYSLLRGKRTEDMIFSGSEQRSRAGMAAATITFDNSDGWLPIDFSEVAITRRAYRDGTNDYLINGQRVRLKDVSELLAQSGLAERTYTIIGQGLVDAALALKAEDRRRLFEEAAGIGLYRSRREESLRRLETTRRNIERVQDILAELEPRLRSLEKQARRAHEYEQLRSDLRLLLRDWYGYHWHRAQQELAEAQKAARIQDSALDRTRSQHDKINTQLNETRERLQALRAKLTGLHRQSANLHNQRVAIGRDLAVNEERLKALANQEENTLGELSQLDELLGMRQEQITAALEELEFLQRELEDAQAQSRLADEELQIAQQHRARAEQEVRAVEENIADLNSQKGEIRARLADRKSQLDQRKSAIEELKSESAKLEETLQSKKQALQIAQDQAEAADIAWKEAFHELEALHSRQAAVEKDRKQAVEELTRVRSDLAATQAQLIVIEQAEAAMAGYSEGTRTLIEAAEQGNLPGVIGALNQRLDVSVDLETAISAALGDFLDAVVINKEPDAALNLLREHEIRGALVPLEAIENQNKIDNSLNFVLGNNPENFPGWIGRASDLVGAPVDLEPIVDLILGQVFVVSDRSAARNLIGQLRDILAEHDHFLPGVGIRVVTLSGEIFYLSGLVMLAAAASSSGQTILGRQRQRREMEITIKQHQIAVDNHQAAVLNLDTQLGILRNSENELGAKEKSTHHNADLALIGLRQVELATEQIRQQVDWQRTQIDRISIEIRDMEEEIRQFGSSLEKIERDLLSQRERLRKESSRMAELSLDTVQIQLAHWRTRVAVNDRAVGDGKRRVEELKQNFELASNQRTALAERVFEIQSAIQSSNNQKSEWLKREGEISQQSEEMTRQLEPIEAELNSLEKEQRKLENEETQARQNLSLYDHRHAQSRILLSRRQEALQSLQRRIEEDFGLVAFEYAEQVTGQAPLPLGDMVEQLPRLLQIPPELEEAIRRLKAQLRRMGTINLEAQAEYLEVSQRYEFMVTQLSDLNEAQEDIRQVILELDELMEREFNKTFESVMLEFKDIFVRLFGGGSARLVLTDPDNLSETGIDIEARLPGRRSQGLSLLSGGERSLTATALVFALLKVSPTPFCLLDEVDAMLDEANVSRFRELLRELSHHTQFVIVTHNRNTVQVADVIYGVTMGRDSASQVIGLKLEEVEQVVNR